MKKTLLYLILPVFIAMILFSCKTAADEKKETLSSADSFTGTSSVITSLTASTTVSGSESIFETGSTTTVPSENITTQTATSLVTDQITQLTTSLLITPTTLSTTKPVTTTALTTAKPVTTTALTTTKPVTTTDLTTTKPVTTTALTTTKPVTTTTPEANTPITYTSSDWMSAVSDNVSLGNIVLPGTHDSGATRELLSGTSKCQTLTIEQQLSAGVRYLDIRLRRVNNSLNVYHGISDQKLTFEEVLSSCYTFLTENPSEVLIMCIKEETDPSGTNDAFDTLIKQHIEKNPNAWYTGASVPSLGQVRGKIVLIRRFSTSGTYGFNASSGWADNTTFTLNTSSGTLKVQDYYENESAEKKWETTLNFFSQMKETTNTYYLNNTSGYTSGLFGLPNIKTVSNYVNPLLLEYLKQNTPDIVGIIATDYMTAELAEAIYSLNF